MGGCVSAETDESEQDGDSQGLSGLSPGPLPTHPALSMVPEGS